MRWFKEGDVVSVTFPADPPAVCAGKTVVGMVQHVCESGLPYIVLWSFEGRKLSRRCDELWLAKAEPGQLFAFNQLGLF